MKRLVSSSQTPFKGDEETDTGLARTKQGGPAGTTKKKKKPEQLDMMALLWLLTGQRRQNQFGLAL